MKEGTVLLVGRPNVGKSTLVNNLVGQKVAITSPKPQTTRFPIRAAYQEERGNIVFVDTPGIFGKTQDYLSKRINEVTLATLRDQVDVIIYLVDHTRRRDREEGKVLGLVRKLVGPKLLVFNKWDIQDPSYMPEYEFMKEEFPDVYYVSAIENEHVGPLLDKIFSLLPEKTESTIPPNLAHPALNIDSSIFVGELIREKVFLMMGQEIPYTTAVLVDQITERTKDLTYIKARILTTNNRYKKMLIGKEGRKIKEIGAYVRKELELATQRKIYLDLTIETDPRWQQTYYS